MPRVLKSLAAGASDSGITKIAQLGKSSFRHYPLAKRAVVTSCQQVTHAYD